MNTGPFNGSAAQRMRTKGSLRSAAIYLADRHNTRDAMKLLAIDAADYWAIRILEALLDLADWPVPATAFPQFPQDIQIGKRKST